MLKREAGPEWTGLYPSMNRISLIDESGGRERGTGFYEPIVSFKGSGDLAWFPKLVRGVRFVLGFSLVNEL